MTVPARPPGSEGLTVAVTGPTGEIGLAAVSALDRSPEIASIIGMARRPFDPAEQGWRKVSYRQGDVLDPAAVAELVRGVDAVVHLAFIIMGDAAQTAAVNLQGSQNVFEATRAAGVPRLVYTSSVAAYGFHADNPQPLTEDVPARGTDAHYYSAQKAEVETLLRETLAGSDTAAYVLRPCIVAGPRRAAARRQPPLHAAVRTPSGGGPAAAGGRADPQAGAARPRRAVPARAPRRRGQRAPRHRPRPRHARRLQHRRARPDRLRVLADELGWYSIPMPELAVDVLSELIGRIGILPTQAQWITAFREPVIMDVRKARRELHWRPRHNALQTLRETVTAARLGSLVR